MQLFHYNSEYPDYETASNNTDGLAAVSFFYEISPTDNVAMDPLLTNIEALEKTIFNPSLDEYEYEVSLAEMDTLEVLLPPDGLQLWDNYYYYSGSETLPFPMVGGSSLHHGTNQHEGTGTLLQHPSSNHINC